MIDDFDPLRLALKPDEANMPLFIDAAIKRFRECFALLPAGIELDSAKNIAELMGVHEDAVKGAVAILIQTRELMFIQGKVFTV